MNEERKLKLDILTLKEKITNSRYVVEKRKEMLGLDKADLELRRKQEIYTLKIGFEKHNPTYLYENDKIFLDLIKERQKIIFKKEELALLAKFDTETRDLLILEDQIEEQIKEWEAEILELEK